MKSMGGNYVPNSVCVCVCKRLIKLEIGTKFMVE